MNTYGDAAEQVVRFTLEGTEVALKLTGSAAKNIAAMLYTVLKDQKRTKGKARMETMLKTKKPMAVYTLKKEDCAEFAKQAKDYGIMYCPIPCKKDDNTVDVLVFQEDAARANRIVERFKLTVVDSAAIKEDIENGRADTTADAPTVPEKDKPDMAEDAMLLDDIMGAPTKKETNAPVNPTAAKTEKSRPSEPISERRSKTAEGTADVAETRPSVREELRDIRARQQVEAADRAPNTPTVDDKKRQPHTTEHRQPTTRKTKKKNKER